MPEISVIVPVYNVEKYLSRCIDSILTQTFTDFELILVDDGSTDKSGKICDEYAAKNSRVFVIHKENGGVAEARNVGLDWIFENSKSKWIAFVDSDDWVHPKYLELLYDANCKYHTDICACDYAVTEDIDKPVEACDNGAERLSPEAFAVKYHKLIDSACGKLYNKNLLRDVRFPNIRISEDASIVYKVLFEETYISVIDASLYCYYQRTESAMHSSWTPENLVEFETLTQRAEYFKSQNYNELYKLGCFRLIYCAYLQLKLMENDEDCIYKKQYEPKIRKYLRERIKYYKKSWDDFSFQEYVWIYEAAYPKRMKVYWTLKSKTDKFTKSNNNSGEQK